MNDLVEILPKRELFKVLCIALALLGLAEIAWGRAMGIQKIECYPVPATAEGLFELRELGDDVWANPKPTSPGLPSNPTELNNQILVLRSQAKEHAWSIPLHLLASAIPPLLLVDLDLIMLPASSVEQYTFWTVFLLAGCIAACVDFRNFYVVRAKRHAAETYLNDLETWVESLRSRTKIGFWQRELKNAHKPGDEFAREVAKLFRHAGWNVKLNQEEDDGGVDIFACSADSNVVIQCKHWASTIGPGVVRELIGSVEIFGATSGYLVGLKFPAESNPRNIYAFSQYTQSDNRRIQFLNVAHLLVMARDAFRSKTSMEPDDLSVEEKGLFDDDLNPLPWNGIYMSV